MSWRKIFPRLAPSSSAASSTSLLMPRKNWRRKKTANGVIRKKGATIPGKVFSQPRFLISTKFGISVKIGGSIIAARKREEDVARPGERQQTQAWAATGEEVGWAGGISVQTITLLGSAVKKFTSALVSVPAFVSSSVEARPSAWRTLSSVGLSGT